MTQRSTPVTEQLAALQQSWIDQQHQLDRYGVALMMIREGCVDPSGLACKILSEFERP